MPRFYLCQKTKMPARFWEKLREEMKIRNHEGLASVITTVVAFGVIGTFTATGAAFNYQYNKANSATKKLSVSQAAAAQVPQKNNPATNPENQHLRYAKDIQGEIGNRKQPDISKQADSYRAMLSKYEKEQTEKKSAAAVTARAIKKPVIVASRGACPFPNEKPRYSKTKGKHMDEDCCPDPDEWPNPRCAYSAGEMGVMRSSPKK